MKDEHIEAYNQGFNEGMRSIGWTHDREQRRYELAKAAMQAYLSNPKIVDTIDGEGVGDYDRLIARNAVESADCLLTALEGADKP